MVRALRPAVSLLRFEEFHAMRTLSTAFAFALTVCGLIGGVWADDKKEASKVEAKNSTKMVIKDMT